MADIEYKCDPERNLRFGDSYGTGIFVRAKNEDGEWGNCDILYLDEESLDHWLRSRDSIDWPIQVVKILMGYPRPTVEEEAPE